MQIIIRKPQKIINRKPRPIIKRKPITVTKNGKYNKIVPVDGRNVLIVPKKKGEDAREKINKWLSTTSGFIEGYACDIDDTPLGLYKYQIAVMFDPSFFIHCDKGRQVGWSFGCSAESLAKAHLGRPYTAIYISINQEEANEKINFGNAIYESLPLDVKKIRVVDNKRTLEFEDANGDRRSRTRLISHAQREPRGKGGNTDVYLDEAAHYIFGDKIYIAAVPIITRGNGRLVIGSTPLGKQGIHYMLSNEPQYKRIYSYHEIFWWNCPELVNESVFDEAQVGAGSYETQERVLKYGNDKLIAIFISMPLEQFQQEYELFTIDETVSFFSLDLIHTCCYEAPHDPIFDEADENADVIDGLFEITRTYPKIDFKIYESLESLAIAVREGRIKPRLFAGYDVGRKKHNAEFAVVEEIGDLHIVRFLEQFQKLDFAKQKSYLNIAMDLFPQLRLGIDNTSIGMNLGEDLWKKYRSRVKRVDFTNPWKEEVATDLHIRFESQTIAIPYMRQVVNQIHSIKRKVTEHGNFKFDAEKNSQHHGDKFWAITLASSMGSKPTKSRIYGNVLSGVRGTRILSIAHQRTLLNMHQRKVPREFDIPHISHELKLSGVKDG